jgi:hypothetical protein
MQSAYSSGLSDYTVRLFIVSKTARLSKSVIETKFVSIFSTILSKSFIVLTRTKRDMIKN